MPDITAPQQQHLDELFNLLEAQGQGNYIGESISQLEHCLQAAYFATQEGADEATVMGALLHDVGQFLPLGHEFIKHQRDMINDMPDASGKSVGRQRHDKLGESYLQHYGWPAKVYKLVGAHVDAKRMLTRDPEYWKQLSMASQASLKHQGGPFSDQEAAEFKSDPLWPNKIQLRLWDDRSKEVDLVTPGLDAYRDMAQRVLLNGD